MLRKIQRRHNKKISIIQFFVPDERKIHLKAPEKRLNSIKLQFQ
jgi:hypothetical protein